MQQLTSPLKVNNIDFALERWSIDCHPLQFLRELTRNAIEAILRYMQSHPGFRGQIVWTVDQSLVDIDTEDGGKKTLRKLCLIDTGDGMTAEEMILYINELASGYNPQDMSGNYGIGAKISTLPGNPYGVAYSSWKDGVGNLTHSWRDPNNGKYGLMRHEWEQPDGTVVFEEYLPLDDSDAVKPKQITEGHGTKVTLYGKTESDDTTLPPPGVQGFADYRWIQKYLNARFFQFPAGIEVRAMEGSKPDPYCRPVKGMSYFLETYSICSGRVGLEGATAHWWLLCEPDSIGKSADPTSEDEEEKKGVPKRKVNNYVTVAGHVATLYQGELYDYFYGKPGKDLLQNFGIIQGYDRVVLYLEPDTSLGKVTTDSARTTLKVDRQSLPWGDWQTEFASKMPKELRDFINSQMGGSTKTSVEDRLKEVRDLYRLKFYKGNKNSKLQALLSQDLGEGTAPFGAKKGGKHTETVTTGTKAGERKPNPNPEPEPPPEPTGKKKQKWVLGPGKRAKATLIDQQFTPGNLYSQVITSSGSRVSMAGEAPFPRVMWVSLDNRVDGDGLRDPEMLQNKFGKFIQVDNLIQLNGDFASVQDDIIRWTDYILAKNKNLDEAGVRKEVTSVVRSWYAVLAVETVMGVQSLRCIGWPQDKVNEVLVKNGEETLTAAAVQRYHTTFAIKRQLGSSKLLD